MAPDIFAAGHVEQLLAGGQVVRVDEPGPEENSSKMSTQRLVLLDLFLPTAKLIERSFFVVNICCCFLFLWNFTIVSNCQNRYPRTLYIYTVYKPRACVGPHTHLVAPLPMVDTMPIVDPNLVMDPILNSGTYRPIAGPGRALHLSPSIM